MRAGELPVDEQLAHFRQALRHGHSRRTPTASAFTWDLMCARVNSKLVFGSNVYARVPIGRRRLCLVDLEAHWLNSVAQTCGWLRMMAAGSGQLAEDNNNKRHGRGDRFRAQLYIMLIIGAQGSRGSEWAHARVP